MQIIHVVNPGRVVSVNLAADLQISVGRIMCVALDSVSVFVS